MNKTLVASLIILFSTCNVHSRNATKVYKQTIDSVVQVLVQDTSNGGVIGELGKTPRLGAGTIISKDGQILTCAHLFPSEDYHIVIITYDKKKYICNLLAIQKEIDLALIEIVETTDTFKFMKISNKPVVIGQTVIGIGHPYRYMWSVSQGIVSALHRSEETGKDLIQTDLSLNKGNSGGPLINLKGQLVGVNNSIGAPTLIPGVVSGSVGISFSVSLETIRVFLKTPAFLYPDTFLVNENHFETNVKEVY